MSDPRQRQWSNREITIWAAPFLFAAISVSNAYGQYGNLPQWPLPGDAAVVARDEFKKELRLDWIPIRNDPSHVSLEKFPGQLTITTQRGSIHEREETDPLSLGTLAKNIFVIENPLPSGADFVITTKVIGFKPDTRWQQAGLIVYNDDDNYLKWSYEFGGSGSRARLRLCILTETDARSLVSFHKAPENADNLWLRLTKRDKGYQFSYSLDGEKFELTDLRGWGDGKPTYLGIIAKNGGNKEAAEIDARFDFFELQTSKAIASELTDE